MRLLALAAAVLAVTVGAVVFHAHLFGGTHYATPIGGIESVPLPDGSRITLNTDTSIRVAFSEDERRIWQGKGEAFFEVAKDKTRPFIVYAGTRRVVVLGTKFSLRMDNDDVEVVVTEGCVKLASEDVHTFCAGAIAHTSKARVVVRSDAIEDAERLLSWREGYVSFEHTPLADAVAEFNRYNHRKIFIEDPSIAAVLIGAKLRPNDIDGFLWLLQTGFPIKVEQTAGHIVLKAR